MRIFVLDSHPLMREAIAILIHRLISTATVTGLDRLASVMSAEQQGLPELICMELELPDNSGVSGIRELRQRYPDTPLLVLSAAQDEGGKDQAISAGASAYLSKWAETAEITKVLSSFLSPKLEATPATPPEKLSKRQKQLLVMLDKGMSNRDIAEALEISEHTVKVHLWRLFRRINVKSRSQASHLARTKGLL
ncbi:two component transcriptional regulator, LuxR family [Polaromonas sp. OV174]|uniref:LuxR C-terminal-related transcriptional regulator n=1 Tax=Polaromonas sp. OV174 TaxID=1855300 RepID=UPI0008E6F32F|nr:response regulator transcription factor [Polaromonas sp. OV174]SFB81210.1 two component transcriptional regulator, LuxR family [Polaromonas sp. OV174]